MTEGMDSSAMFLVRIGDEERDACVDALTEHHLRGRLSAEEFDRRQQAALEASTAADLGRLVADLPTPTAEPQRVPRTPAAGFDLRRAALWAAPPVAIASSAAITSTVIADAAGMATTPGVFWVSAFTGAVGYATHWALSRFRKG
jgi:hypothetical protein